ncbi:MAG: VIT and VWA domain-containing protein, partial [Planctomycetota bacterium]
MKYTSFILLLISLMHLQAQDSGRVNLPPTLMVRENNQLIPIILEKLDIEVSIRGLLAETTMTMTFYNSQARVLEGELLFPLPEGATISGYALDINGALMEGVVVEKQEARIAFEKEVRKGVDPGLIEWTKGNNFRTRVYPIPASGRRTIRVHYINELIVQSQKELATSGTLPLVKNVYYLPLQFKNSIPSFSLKIAVYGEMAPSEIQGDFPLEFKTVEGGSLSAVTFKNIAFTKDLFLHFASLPANFVKVEQDEEGENYFVGHLLTEIPAARAKSEPLQKVLLLWDASLSCEKSKKNQELQLLENLCKASEKLTIDVLAFRNTPDPVKTFEIQQGDVKELFQFLNQLQYDGGTDFSCLKSLPVSSYNFAILFTDGLFTIGECENFQFAVPLYPVSSDPRANHGLLKYLARLSGGEYLNLNRVSLDRAHARLGTPSFVFLGAEYNPNEIQEVYPIGREVLTERLDITGRLLVPEATLKIKIGYGTQILGTMEVIIKKENSGKTGLFPRFWAQ